MATASIGRSSHKNTQERERVIDQMHQAKHIDDMTEKWLSQTPNPPRTSIFYTLTKIHKPVPVGRPITDLRLLPPLLREYHLLRITIPPYRQQ